MPQSSCWFNLAIKSVFCGLLFCAPVASADDTPSLGAIANHDHKPIHVRSKPVIERLAVKVIDPVDLVLSNKGYIYVADRKAECVFRIDEFGSVSVVKQSLQGIERIQVDGEESVYILTSSGGESSLHQVTAAGQHIVLQNFAFPAKSFVRDEIGQFTLGLKQTGRIVSLSSEGTITTVAELTQTPQDLILNAGGQLEALLPSGHVVRISEEGEVTASGFAEVGSSRLSALADGTLLTLVISPVGRSQVSQVARDGERPEQFPVVATVPAGTNAVGFDSLGNLCLANSDLRAITKVTSQFKIACPHCGKPTRMIFSLEPALAADSDTRSF